MRERRGGGFEKIDIAIALHFFNYGENFATNKWNFATNDMEKKTIFKRDKNGNLK